MFKSRRNENRLGIPLYINSNVNPTSLQSEGLVRLAVTTLTALANHSHFEITVFVPKKFKKNLKLELGEFPKGKALVRSPLTNSFTSILNNIRIAVSRFNQKRRINLKTQEKTARNLIILIASNNLLVALAATTIGLALVFYFNEIEADALVKLAFLVASGVALIGGVVLRRKLVLKGKTSWTTPENIYSVLEKSDVDHLVKFAARSGITKWWLPSSMFSGLLGLPGKKVVTFADFVAFEKPSMILSNGSQLYRASEIKTVLNGVDAIVTLSDYVRESHLPKLLDKKEVTVHCIPTGPAMRQSDSSEKEIKDVTYISKNFPGSNLGNREWWADPVITIPSQNRPYKNIEKVVLAAQNLNASGCKIRVVLTCEPSTMKEFLKHHDCETIVEFAHRSTDATLQMIIRESTLVCNPSFFEANIPFTLFEGVSLGTPALLADIKSTRHGFSGFEKVANQSLFNPYEISDIESKILFALNNREQILRNQEEFLGHYFHENSWINVAMQYEEVFRQLSTKPKGVAKW